MSIAASARPDTRKGTRSGLLIAGWAGVLWPVVAFFRVPLTQVADQPSWTAEPSAILSFYTDSTFDTSFVTGIALAMLSYLLFLVFVVRVADLVGATYSRWAGHLIVGAAAVDAALVFASLAPFAAAVFWAGHGGLSADAYLALHGLSFSFLWLDLIIITLWMTPLGVAVVRTRLFPVWLGWAILINAAALLISFFLGSDVWFVTGGLPYLWILTGGLLMIRRADRYTALASA